MATDLDHFVSRRPRCRPCPVPQCKSLMLSGIDQGIPYRVDPVPINLMGELTALASGLKTYEWRMSGHIWHRTHWRMKTDAKYGHPITLATHRHCYDYPIEHIEGSHYRKLKLLFDLATRRTVKDDDPSADEHEMAIFTVHELTGGAIVDDKPPF